MFFDAHCFFIRIYGPEKIGDCTCTNYRPFFCKLYFQVEFFKLLFISSSTILAITPWSTSTSLKMQLSYYSWNMKHDLFSNLFYVPILHDLLVYYNIKINMTCVIGSNRERYEVVLHLGLWMFILKAMSIHECTFWRWWCKICKILPTFNF